MAFLSTETCKNNDKKMRDVKATVIPDKLKQTRNLYASYCKRERLNSIQLKQKWKEVVKH